MPRLVLAAETGPELGLGHVVRTISLAAHAGANWSPVVVCLNKASGTVDTLARRYGVDCQTADDVGWSLSRPQSTAALVALDPDVLVLDSPLISAESARVLTDSSIPFAYFGGTGVPLVPADGYIWPGTDLRPNAQARETLSGIENIPLAPAFSMKAPRKRDGRIRTVLITMGGVDRYDVSSIALRSIEAVLIDPVDVRVAIGAFFTNGETIKRQASASRHRVTLLEAPEELTEVMNVADLAISGGGGTLSELACLGVPAIGVEISANQRAGVRFFDAQGSIIGHKFSTAPQLEADLVRSLSSLLVDSTRVREMSATGRHLIDGRGAGRILNWLVTTIAQ